jgi:hypothetical protein
MRRGEVGASPVATEEVGERMTIQEARCKLYEAQYLYVYREGGLRATVERWRRRVAELEGK